MTPKGLPLAGVICPLCRWRNRGLSTSTGAGIQAFGRLYCALLSASMSVHVYTHVGVFRLLSTQGRVWAGLLNLLQERRVGAASEGRASFPVGGGDAVCEPGRGCHSPHQPLGPQPPSFPCFSPLLFKTNTREPKPPIQPRHRWSPSWN